MIKNFKCSDTEALFHRKFSEFPPNIRKVGYRKLLMIDAATDLKDLKIPPGNRLEKLKGDRKGRHSIRINDQWRICFKWQKGDAYDVEINKHYQ